jgi:hypothetical protein
MNLCVDANEGTASANLFGKAHSPRRLRIFHVPVSEREFAIIVVIGLSLPTCASHHLRAVDAAALAMVALTANGACHNLTHASHTVANSGNSLSSENARLALPSLNSARAVIREFATNATHNTILTPTLLPLFRSAAALRQFSKQNSASPCHPRFRQTIADIAPAAAASTPPAFCCLLSSDDALSAYLRRLFPSGFCPLTLSEPQLLPGLSRVHSECLPSSNLRFFPHTPQLRRLARPVHKSHQRFRCASSLISHAPYALRFPRRSIYPTSEAFPCAGLRHDSIATVHKIQGKSPTRLSGKRAAGCRSWPILQVLPPSSLLSVSGGN